MSKIEKIILVIIALIIVYMVFAVRSCNAMIEENGGIREIVIAAGKDVKQISKEISDD